MVIILGMKTEKLSKRFYLALEASVGRHSTIARKAGISQASISRYHLHITPPPMPVAERIVAIVNAESKRASSTRSVQRAKVRVKRAAPATATALGQ